MSAVLLLTGGPDHAHDFAATAPALADAVSGLGHDVRLADDPDAAASALTDAVDALVVNALRWRMLDAAYDALRPQWSYTTTASTRDAIAGFVRRGGGLLASHTAPICFDDWPEWGDLVGGSWQWGLSSHPPPGPVAIQVVADHPVVAGLPASFELVDEIYGDLDVRADVEVLAVAKRSADDRDQPVVWAHQFGSGRVVYDAFGHDEGSLRQPQHVQLLQQSLEWVLGPV